MASLSHKVRLCAAAALDPALSPQTVILAGTGHRSLWPLQVLRVYKGPAQAFKCVLHKWRDVQGLAHTMSRYEIRLAKPNQRPKLCSCNSYSRVQEKKKKQSVSPADQTN
ncbi:hypothetical protein WJX79_010180 [Trebouxia sp. C0005]